MIDPIHVFISPNETNTQDRVDDLMKAIEASHGQFEYIGKDPKQPADVCLRNQNKRIHIEIKDTNHSNDIWGSKQGHIGDQLVKLLDEFSEAFIVVCGSYDECLLEVPTMTTQRTKTGTKTHWAGRDLQESNKTTLRALNADAYGSTIPIFYLSKNRILSFKEMLSYGKARLLGANPFQWSSPHKGKAGKIKAIMGAQGIGLKNSEALLQHFGSIRNIALASYDDLVACPGIGRERAIAIMELMK